MAKMTKIQKELAKLSLTADKRVEKRLKQIFQKTLTRLGKEVDDLLSHEEEVKFWRLFRASQLQGMQNQLNDILYDHYQELNDDSYAYLKLKEQLGWDEAFYQANNKYGIAFDRVNYNQAYALATYDDNELANRLSNHLYNNTNQLAKNVVEKLDNTLVMGTSSAKIANELKRDVKQVLQKELNSEYQKAIRIVRTENTRIQAKAKQASMEHVENLGIEVKKMWVASLDSRTRSQHGALDGKKIGVHEQFVVDGHRADCPGDFGVAHLDINCRCAIVTVVEGYEPKTRKDNITKENVKYNTYEDWKQSMNGDD